MVKYYFTDKKTGILQIKKLKHREEKQEIICTYTEMPTFLL